MKIEAGKSYITRSGRKIGPMVIDDDLAKCTSTDVVLFANTGLGFIRGVAGFREHEDDAVFEYNAPFRIEAGKTYATACGHKVGPMTKWGEFEHPFEQAGGSNTFNPSGNLWREDGSSSYSPALVREWVDADGKTYADTQAEIDRLKSVASGLRGKLNRVQNIHANTIKNLRKARADVKKVNKALSDEQGRTHSLSARLAEVVKSATEAADYAKGIERTAPKKKRAVSAVDIGATRCVQPEKVASLIPSNRNPNSLMAAFAWDTTPQGWRYWSDKYNVKEQINAADILFFKALLDKHKASK